MRPIHWLQLPGLGFEIVGGAIMNRYPDEVWAYVISMLIGLILILWPLWMWLKKFTVPYLRKVSPMIGIISFVAIGAVVGAILGGVVAYRVWPLDPPATSTQELSEEEARRQKIRWQLQDEGIGWHISMYHDRVRRGDIDRVHLFWEGGMAVDEQDSGGRTVLHMAARAGYVTIVKEAIEQGADVNATTPEGLTPLVEAINHGHEHVVRELINNKAEIDNRNLVDNPNGGCTALSLAVGGGHIGIVRLLLDQGARINVANNSGMTPLMAAAYRKRDEIVTLLIESGADLTAQDSMGANAMDYALIDQRESDAHKILENAGRAPTKPKKTSVGSSSSHNCHTIKWKIGG